MVDLFPALLGRGIMLNLLTKVRIIVGDRGWHPKILVDQKVNFVFLRLGNNKVLFVMLTC